MIYSLRGILELVEPYHIVVECGGVGYSVRTSMTTISELPPTGETVKIYTYLNVREDAVELYGYATREELDMFKLLTSVSGVGPKGAMSLLSSMAPDRLSLCIASGDAKALRAPGVGAKTAERILLELKDKVSNQQVASGVTGGVSSASGPTMGNASEAVSALEVLGYSRAEATRVITGMDPETPVEEMIKCGLKALSGGRK